ncbi:MAG: hypothetical protein H6737_08750 [Alphaproteobacteria bacterium]|nr:hypothetical protein [Alphaproteobacteria bacterium]
MIALVSAALAGACTDTPLPQGPLTAALQPGDLGRARTACLRSEVGLGGGAALVIDTADFYGRIQLMGTVDGRIALPDVNLSIDLGVEPYRSDSVIAPISVGAAGLGASWVGATWQFEEADRSVLALTSRVVLPTASGAQNARPLAADIGLVGQYQWTEKTSVHGGLTLYGNRMVGPGPAVPRTAMSGLVGLAFQPTGGFALVLDVPMSVAWSAPVDYLALSPGVRVGTGPWALELGVMKPLAGGDRTLLAADLRTSIRFD